MFDISSLLQETQRTELEYSFLSDSSKVGPDSPYNKGQQSLEYSMSSSLASKHSSVAFEGSTTWSHDSGIGGHRNGGVRRGGEGRAGSSGATGDKAKAGERWPQSDLESEEPGSLFRQLGHLQNQVLEPPSKQMGSDKWQVLEEAVEVLIQTGAKAKMDRAEQACRPTAPSSERGWSWLGGCLSDVVQDLDEQAPGRWRMSL
mmetsp:Transcript_3960/g.12034  ORF Transcript_3960/g.12034 Transcript_3960/m.12034 type:complete len:202 (-) Transcript_3960:87-692(-)